MASLDRLEARLAEISRALVQGVERVGQRVISEIGQEIVPATPVDTGFARGNWRPSLGAPSPVPVSVLDPTGAATVARIAAVGLQFRVGLAFYLVNRAPYIADLNRGSSAQAPAGFVQDAVERATRRGVATATRRGVAT